MPNYGPKAKTLTTFIKKQTVRAFTLWGPLFINRFELTTHFLKLAMCEEKNDFLKNLVMQYLTNCPNLQTRR